jgi:hypothetical protein
MNYFVNIRSLHENFPTHFEVPRLLLDFGNWLKTQRRGSVGYFNLKSNRFNDFWIENGADLHVHFAFFLCDPTGGHIGYWFHEREAVSSPPIVLVGSEGELRNLGNSLEVFLTRLANGQTQVPDLDSRDDGDGSRHELAAWLASHADSTSSRAASAYPDLGKWMENWGQQQRDWIDQDSGHIQIADRLRRYVRPNAEPWETENFDVLLVGSQFKMWHRTFGPKPMPKHDVADFESLFRSVRERRAQTIPERGLWFSAWVKVGARGGAIICSNFMDEPQILDERPVIPRSDYDRDLNAFPRSKHWMPKWLEPQSASS